MAWTLAPLEQARSVTAASKGSNCVSQSADVPKGRCYGGRKCAKVKRADNADTYQRFAVSVELILNRGYDVTQKGNLIRLT